MVTESGCLGGRAGCLGVKADCLGGKAGCLDTGEFDVEGNAEVYWDAGRLVDSPPRICTGERVPETGAESEKKHVFCSGRRACVCELESVALGMSWSGGGGAPNHLHFSLTAIIGVTVVGISGEGFRAVRIWDTGGSFAAALTAKDERMPQRLDCMPQRLRRLCPLCPAICAAHLSSKAARFPAMRAWTF